MTAHPTTIRLVLSAAAVLISASALSGCAVLERVFPAQAERDEETQEIASAGQQDVFEVAVGDCFNEEAETTGEEDDEAVLSELPAVPCSEPHDNEIYHLLDLAGEEFPVDVDARADDACFAQFAAFVGIEYDVSTEIDYFAIYPTALSWGDGDREVICSVYDMTKQTTGTLAGAAR